MVILTEREAKQYRELDALLKKVGIDLEILMKVASDFAIIKDSLNAVDKGLSELRQRVQDLELNKKINPQVTPKQILNELMGDEVPKINEEI